MAIENKGHDMGFLKKFMMENAGAAAVKRLVERFGDVSSKKVLVYAGLGNNGGDVSKYFVNIVPSIELQKFYFSRLSLIILRKFCHCIIL